MPLREDLENGAPVGLPPFLIRDGQGGNEWLPAQGNDPNRALPFAILPFSEMPQLINPPRGFIVNSNNDPTGNSRDNNVLNVRRPGGGIRYIGSGYGFDLGIRAGRIEQLLTSFLASGRKLGVQDLQRVQSDVVMGDASFFVPFIVRALGNALRPGAPGELTSFARDPRIVEAVARMAVWDRSTPTGIVEGFDASDQNGKRAQPHVLEIANSIAATIYSVWRNQIVNQTLSATLSRHGLVITSPRDIQLTAVKNLVRQLPAALRRRCLGHRLLRSARSRTRCRSPRHRALAQLEHRARPAGQSRLRRCLQWLHQPVRLSLGTPASSGAGASARRTVQHSARGWRLPAAATESAGNSYRWRPAHCGSRQPSVQPRQFQRLHVRRWPLAALCGQHRVRRHQIGVESAWRSKRRSE